MTIDRTTSDFDSVPAAPVSTGPTTASCCSAAKQSTCCTAGDKAACCGADATAGDGCGCH